MNEFRAEMAGLSTEDLILIYTDQKDLYRKDELLVIESELLSRTEITGKKPYPLKPETVFKAASSDKVANLLRAIRRTGEDGDYQEAVMYCRQAIAEEPNSWEAIFYLAYYDTLQGSSADLHDRVEKLYHKIHTILHLVWESGMDADATKSALREIDVKLRVLTNSLYHYCIARHNKYNNPLHTTAVRTRVYQETQLQISNLYSIAFEFGDCLCQMFGNRGELAPFIRDTACAAWSYGIEMQSRWVNGFEKMYAAELIQQYIEKIKIFKPDYLPPKGY